MMQRATSAMVLVVSILVQAAFSAKGADLAFRRHDLNPDSIYCACAVIDVNRDGRQDIVCGGWWYEAPAWTQHFLRDVEMIRGRYDDYSNLPLDVNQDGWIDLVSANYRSQTLYWIEHPGKSLGPWTAHAIERPGAMETGRLADVNSDGQLDVLPNGMKFAAWWEIVHEGDAGFHWQRHELPKELAAHGIGCGDINSDGHNDLVGPRGWAEAVTDKGPHHWRWRPEFQLHRDGSIPILVFDVDADGDNDIVWGRGHHTGLYWLEQVPKADSRSWTWHTIDTSWSQPHSILLGDLDNDGRPELIAGKRYMGHDGHDPGEYDPLIVCAYSFEPSVRIWKRAVLSVGGHAGFGLDPKLADLDADGDLDIVCSGRSGLFWFENLLNYAGALPQTAVQPKLVAPDYSDHTNLLVYKDEQGKTHPVQTLADWAIRRAHILANMQRVMGNVPDSASRVPLDVQVLSEETTADYVRRKITFAVEPADRVPAWLLIPNRRKARMPAMLCLHPTTRMGKDEVAGIDGRPSRQYGHELACRGYVCLVPDYPSFGDYAYDFDAARDHYASGTMKAIWNNIRALDLLESLPEVDWDRIGCIGHSLGAHNALFTAAFDLRVQAVVSSCGFTAFHDYYDGNLKGWTSARYMPRIRDEYQSDPDRVPFDFSEVLAAIAPRPIFINAPLHDANFAISGVHKVVESVRPVDKLLGKPNRLHVVSPDCAHDFPDAIRTAAYDWLDQVLKK